MRRDRGQSEAIKCSPTAGLCAALVFTYLAQAKEKRRCTLRRCVKNSPPIEYSSTMYK